MVKVIGWGKTQQQTDWRGRVFSALTRRLVCHLHRDSFFCTAITCGADFLSLNSPLPPSKPSSQSFCDHANPLLHCPSSSSPSLQSLPRCLLLSKCSFFFHSSVLPPSQWHATVLRSKSRPRSQAARGKCLWQLDWFAPIVTAWNVMLSQRMLPDVLSTDERQENIPHRPRCRLRLCVCYLTVLSCKWWWTKLERLRGVSAFFKGKSVIIPKVFLRDSC